MARRTDSVTLACPAPRCAAPLRITLSTEPRSTGSLAAVPACPRCGSPKAIDAAYRMAGVPTSAWVADVREEPADPPKTGPSKPGKSSKRR